MKTPILAGQQELGQSSSTNQQINNQENNNDHSSQIEGNKNNHPTMIERIKHHVGHHLHAPSFMKDNQFIHSGYRINFSSMKSIAKSMFMVHNELVNIWSHFVGAVLVIVLMIYLLNSFGNVDINSWKQQLISNVSEKFHPLYNQLLAFDDVLNKKVQEGVDYLCDNDHHMIENISIFFNELKNEISPHNVEQIMEKWQQFYTKYSERMEQNSIEGLKSKVKLLFLNF